MSRIQSESDRRVGRIEAVRRLVEGHRFLAAHVAYVGLAALALWASYLLRFEGRIPSEEVAGLLAAIPYLLVARLVANWPWGLASPRWRFVGTREVVRLGGAIFTGSAIFAAAIAVVPGAPSVPRSIFLIEAALTTLAVAALWLSYRLAFESSRRSQNRTDVVPKRVIVVGAGDAGNQLVRELTRNECGYRVVGLVDDDPLKRGTRLQGMEVLGSTGDLASMVGPLAAEEVVIAIPSAGPNVLRAIVERCRGVGIPIKVLPGIRGVLDGDVGPDRLRAIRIEDLLGRDPISLALPELEEDLAGKVVLVTGAAGSIGSELARQIAANDPAELILLDQAESNLFFVERELREANPGLAIRAVVADILDGASLRALFREQAIARVYHAAAYKHVPLMESNVRSAVLNNVLGTWRIAEAAGERGVGKFVLVSTDKAVRPVNAMGMTKRLAELVVTGCQLRFPTTEFLAVRFGNVLGSAGSVVPIFQAQLREGKPLTVTHADVTRYFMTIAEAVQLVLQASLLPRSAGKIAMLDMGEPVKIMDLARTMILLSGKRPGVDVPIVLTGLRPGEKLTEELSAPEEATEETSIEKVRLLGSRNGEGGRRAEVLRAILDEVESWSKEEANGRDAEWERLRRLLRSAEALAHAPAPAVVAAVKAPA